MKVVVRKKKPAAKPAIHPKAVVDAGSYVGGGTRVWAFAHIMKGARVGEHCNIGEGCFIEKGSRIGNHVTVKNGVSVWEKVVIEDGVFVGPNAVFTNDLLPVSRQRAPFLPTVVKRGACIGANATVLCGRKIGQYAFLGAGSVLTQDLPDHALAYGNPARIRGYLCACRQKLAFKKDLARCRCGLKFSRRSKNSVQMTSS